MIESLAIKTEKEYASIILSILKKHDLINKNLKIAKEGGLSTYSD